MRSLLRALTYGSLTLSTAWLLACAAAHDPSGAPSSSQAPDSSTSGTGGDMTSAASVAKIIDEVVSCFENSTKTVQYNYIEALGDGRGYTAGKAGFTTGTGDLYDLVTRYLSKYRDSDLQSILPTLEEDADSGSGSIKGLEKLPSIWARLSKTVAFRAAQDAETNVLYANPAAAYVSQYGLKTNIAKLVFYDTIIQHGDGDDPDSFRGVIRKMDSRPKSETAFLIAFLEARRKILMNPSDSSTTDEWRGSVDRVNALERLITQGHLTLAPPFVVEVFGDSYAF